MRVCGLLFVLGISRACIAEARVADYFNVHKSCNDRTQDLDLDVSDML